MIRKYLTRIFLLFMVLFFPIKASSAETVQSEKLLITFLDNGLEVAIQPMAGAPLVSCQLWIRAGSITEEKHLGSGISYCLEQLLFKKSPVIEKIEQLGGDVSSYTSFDRTVFSITIPQEHLSRALNMMRDIVSNALFEEKEFKETKKEILEEISSSEKKPEEQITHLLWKNSFSVHPYQYPIKGERSKFEKIELKDMNQYFQKQYVPNNMLLVITGDVQPVEAFNQVEKSFSLLKMRPVRNKVPLEPPQTRSRFLEKQSDFFRNYLYLAFHGPGLKSPDVAPIDLLAVILGQGKKSRLARFVKGKQKLADGIDAWSYTQKRVGLFAVFAVTSNKNLERLQDLIWEEIDTIQANGVSEKELQRAQKVITKEVLKAKETVSGFASTLGSNLFAAEDPNYDLRYLEQIKKVRSEDIQKVANTYLTQHKAIVSLLRPKVSETILTKRIERRFSEDKIQKRRLSNGITLLIRPIAGESLTSIMMVFKGGVLSETKEMNGICRFMTQFFLKGTELLSEKKMTEKLEALGAEIMPYAGYNSFGCRMNVNSKNWKEGFSLLAEVIQHPRFRSSDFEEVKKSALIRLQAKEEESFDETSKLLREALFKTHPYRMQSSGTLQSIKRLTLNDLEDYYHKWVNSKNMVISISGAVNVDQVVENAEMLFSSFRSLKTPVFKMVYEPVPRKPVKEVKLKELDQAEILIGFRGVDIFNPDQYPLELISEIFSSQRMRLFDLEDLSSESGAFQVVGLDPGFFVFYAKALPNKNEEVIEALFKSIRFLKDNGLLEEELEKAKTSLIKKHQDQLAQSPEMAFKIALDELYGLGYKNHQNYAATIQAITKEEIVQLARKYFNEKSYVLIEVK